MPFAQIEDNKFFSPESKALYSAIQQDIDLAKQEILDTWRRGFIGDVE